MRLRYSGEFLSREGVTWRADIFCDSEQPFAAVGDMDFDADTPLAIEWPETAKEECLCGSTATLRVISPGDRTYTDLYTVRPGAVRLDVYREDELYWSGTMDPEQYEEPYESAAGYTVELTFADFGILSRVEYDLAGVRTLEDITLRALAAAGINYAALDAATYCSTSFPDGAPATIAAVSVRSDNFTDEDGERATMSDALEGALQPLGLRMIQRAGRVYVYDLNGLHAAAGRAEVWWSGDRQTLGVDKVASRVEIDFSPYSAGEKMLPEIEYKGTSDPALVNTAQHCDRLADGTSYYSFYPNNGERLAKDYPDVWNIDFTIFLNATRGSGLAGIYPGASAADPPAYYARVLPITGGASETDCVLWGMRLPTYGKQTNEDPGVGHIRPVGMGSDRAIITSERVFLPALAEADRASRYVRLTQELLADTRYNPFNDADSGNCNANTELLKGGGTWAFIPVAVTIYGDDGEPLCHYDNSNVTRLSAIGAPRRVYGKWVDGPAAYGDAWLAYYDPEDLKKNTGLLGWQTNRHNIGRPDAWTRHTTGYGNPPGDFIITSSFRKMPRGEYMPYPPRAGWLEVKIFDGLRIYAYMETLNNKDFDTSMASVAQAHLMDKFRWLLYKAPQAEIVGDALTFEAEQLDDIQYTGWLNREAADTIDLSTVCGTSDKPCPAARGIYMRADTGEQITELCRAGHTDHPERLLIGTLYSQHAAPHVKLSGEAALDSGGLRLYTDRNQPPAAAFLCAGETQDCAADTSEMTLIELSPDQYTAIEDTDDE